MRPGEVQRWRLLNATDGDNLQLVLVSKEAEKQGLGLNVVAMDGITGSFEFRMGDVAPGERLGASARS
jgi:hypothetical protein